LGRDDPHAADKTGTTDTTGIIDETETSRPAH